MKSASATPLTRSSGAVSHIPASRRPRLGGPDVLYIGEVADPASGRGQVAVRVRAAGLNPIDAKLRSGSDLAGTVEAGGEGATYWDGTPVVIGDEVLGRGPGSVRHHDFLRSLGMAPVAYGDGLADRIAAGRLVLPVAATSGLDDVAAAFTALESSHAPGKIVVLL